MDSFSDQSQPRRQASPLGPVRGMDSVVATVSGYHGTERFALIKLISATGASYVGPMSRSVTHLICRNFQGKKFHLATKFDTIIINHQWIEDCLIKGNRVSERPYMLKSGQEVGPLLLQVPTDSDAVTRKRKVLSDQSNIFPVPLSGVEKVPQEKLTHSILLKQKQKEPINSSRRRKGEKNNSLIYDKYLSRKENHPGHSNNGSPPHAESNSRRRLMKKNIIREIPSIALDSDEDCCVIEPGSTSDNRTTSLGDLYGALNHNEPATGARDTSPSRHGNKCPVRHEGNDEIESCNNQCASPNIHANTSSPTVTLDPENESNHVPGITMKIQEKIQSDSVAKPPATSELSCVICWTDFSSTRGVLSCGHRFCFTCIRDWANNMTSRKRIATCPLCKTSFASITIVEDAACSDQKIYSQSIPFAQSTTDIYLLTDQHMPSTSVQIYREPVCVECRSREPADLLITCEVCRTLCIHCYCLDPPVEPWTCVHCRDPRMSNYWPR